MTVRTLAAALAGRMVTWRLYRSTTIKPPAELNLGGPADGAYTAPLRAVSGSELAEATFGPAASLRLPIQKTLSKTATRAARKH